MDLALASFEFLYYGNITNSQFLCRELRLLTSLVVGWFRSITVPSDEPRVKFALTPEFVFRGEDKHVLIVFAALLLLASIS
jgi:hypothetical protein